MEALLIVFMSWKRLQHPDETMQIPSTFHREVFQGVEAFEADESAAATIKTVASDSDSSNVTLWKSARLEAP